MLEIDLISKIVRCISIFIEYLIFIKVLNFLEQRKYNTRYLDIIFLLICLLEITIYFNSMNKYYEFIEVLKNIAFIIFVKINYKLNNFKVLLIYFIYSISYDIIDELVLVISCFLITGHSLYGIYVTPKHFDSICIIKDLIMIFININYINILKKFKNINKEKMNIIFIIGCIISNFIIAIMNSLPMSAYIRSLETYNNQLIVFNLFITPRLSVISSIVLLAIILKSIKEIKDRNEENLLKEKIDMQYKYYLNLQETQNKVKRLYHDMSNHMMCIKTMSSEQKDLNNYIDSISNDLNEFKEIYNTGNIILDIILNEKQAKCNENNINLKCDVNFSRCSFIEMTDICSIFSNILDNAIEACNKIEGCEKYINLRGTVVKSYYVIRCENSKINKVKMINNKIITSKKDKFIHGIGLKSVKSSLKKYDGELEINDFEDRFLAQIYIPINENMTVESEKIPVVP